MQHMQNQVSVNGLQNQHQQQIEQNNELYTRNQHHLTAIIGNLNSTAEKFLTELNLYVNLCENLILHWTKDELISWKRQQKTAQYGNPDSITGLATLSERYSIMTEYVFTAWKYAQRVGTMLKKLPAWAPRMDALQAKLHTCFYQLLNSSFLVIQQPPIITKNLINVRVGILGAIDKFGFESQSTKAKCRIISEDTAGELKRNPERIDDPNIKVAGTLKDKPGFVDTVIERLNNDNVLGFEFKHLKIKVDSRKKEAKNGEAIKRKYYLLFDCTVVVGEKDFRIFTLSLPFMVSVHGSQDNDLWAKALWDMAFSDGINDIPMNGRPEVPWSELARALKAVFTCIMYANTERKSNELSLRGLTDDDLEYIKMRLFNGCLPAHPDPMISWTRFYDDSLMHMTKKNCKLQFSFWEWFFRIADMLQEKAGHETKVKSLWNLKLIEGFVSKLDAERRLQSRSQPTFLLRFSDNNLGSISAVVLYENREVDHLVPFLHKEEINDKNNLPACILHCEELEGVNFVYPDHDKKEIADQLPVLKPKNEANSGYVKRVSKVNVYGDTPTRRISESAPCTPAYPPTFSPGYNDYTPKFQQPVSPYFIPFPDNKQNAGGNQSTLNQPAQIMMTNSSMPMPVQSEDISMSDEDLLDIFEYLSAQPDFMSMENDYNNN